MNQKMQELNKKFERILQECPEISFVGDPILRSKTETVTFEEGVLIGKQLQNVLQKYRAITGYGRGLAAPQMGLGKAVFVTFVNDAFETYINPKIETSSPEVNFYRETCLSCGTFSVDVKRSRSVEIEYLNEENNVQKKSVDGFLARLLQHEYGHLEGIVNIDKGEVGSIEFLLNDPLQEKLRDQK